MWDWIVAHQPGITAITGAITAACFTASVFVAKFQISKAWRSQKEATARTIFNDYLSKALTNPILAYPQTYPEKFDLATKKLNGSIKEFERYEWFVSILILAMREILDSISYDKHRRMTVQWQIGYHEEKARRGRKFR